MIMKKHVTQYNDMAKAEAPGTHQQDQCGFGLYIGFIDRKKNIHHRTTFPDGHNTHHLS